MRLFHMRIDFARVVPMVGRDAYVDGHGDMKGKLAGLVTVANGSGHEFDLGELVTYLNDAVVLAPSMLLDDSTTWSEVDDESFDIELRDGAHVVHARVFVDAEGTLVDFSTDDRWCDLPGGLVQARWSTPFDGWVEVDGRPWPTTGRAGVAPPRGPAPLRRRVVRRREHGEERCSDGAARPPWTGASSVIRSRPLRGGGTQRIECA